MRTPEDRAYLANCDKMIAQNKEKVEETKKKLRDATLDELAHRYLELELQGWIGWVKKWENWKRIRLEAIKTR